MPEVVNQIKGASAYQLLKIHPELRLPREVYGRMILDKYGGES